jgi:hypothetical protein
MVLNGKFDAVIAKSMKPKPFEAEPRCKGREGGSDFSVKTTIKISFASFAVFPYGGFAVNVFLP